MNWLMNFNKIFTPVKATKFWKSEVIKEVFKAKKSFDCSSLALDKLCLLNFNSLSSIRLPGLIGNRITDYSFLINVKIDVLKLRLALLLFCRSRPEATGVHLCGLDQLWGRLEAAGVEALLRSAPLHCGGQRTEDALSGHFCRRTRRGRSPSSDTLFARFHVKRN